MVQLALLLVGSQAVQRHWRTLGAIGTAWTLLGLVVLIDPLDGVQDITTDMLGTLLVIEGVVTLAVGLLAEAPGRAWAVRAAVLIIPGLLIIETPWRNVVLNSVLFGLALLADGTIRIAGTLLVRFPGWRIAVAAGALEIVLAVLALLPWPVSYQATVPFCVGVALALSGWAVLRSAHLLRRLPPDASVTSLPIFQQQRGWRIPAVPPVPRSPDRDGAAGQQMIVHVWTAVASSADPVRRPLIDRYVAAVDKQGAIATGHAALGMPPDLYISHYGTNDADRSASEFRDALHAGEQNSVTGRFLPSYAAEAAEWCEATEHVVFHRFSPTRLEEFWAAYRQDPTYNLTNRNCSVAVALALDAALEGVLGRDTGWPRLLRLATHPDLHLATLLRKRAESMTWTPGLVLDYARALLHVVEPPALSLAGTFRRVTDDYRHIRRDYPRAAAPRRIGAA